MLCVSKKLSLYITYAWCVLITEITIAYLERMGNLFLFLCNVLSSMIAFHGSFYMSDVMAAISYYNALGINAYLLLLWFSVSTNFSITCVCRCIIHLAYNLPMLGKRQNFEYDTIIFLSAKFHSSCNYNSFSYSILFKIFHR